jgi:serine/threonine-protein kinase
MTVMEVVARVLRDDPTPLTHYRPDLPGLWAIVAQCLEKDRERRFQTLTDFVNALAPFAPPEMADYVTRIAKQQGMQAAPARPTSPMNLLPAELAAPSAAPAATVAPSSAVVPSAPLAPTGKPAALRAAMILAAAAVLCGVAALFLRLRAPTPHAEHQSAMTASAQTTTVPPVPTPSSTPIGAPAPVPAPVASPASTGPAREAPAATPAPPKVKAPPRNLPPAAATARPAKNVYDP